MSPEQAKGDTVAPAAPAPAEEASAEVGPHSLAPREDSLAYDLMRLAAFESTPVPRKEEQLEGFTRDTVQFVVNKLFALPRVKSSEGPAVALPTEGSFKMPRQRPVPKQKPKTRWEKFMEQRDMKKRKRSRLVYDEASGDWKPRWGYKSAKKGEEDVPVIEVKAGQDPYDDPFEKKSAEKKLIIARQKMREVRNKVEAAEAKLASNTPDLGGKGKTPLKLRKQGLKERLAHAQVSTASLGKFDRKVAGEENLQKKVNKAVMRSSGDESAHYMKMANKVLLSDGFVDRGKAAKAGAGEERRGKPERKPKAQKRRSKQGGNNKFHKRKGQK